MAPEEAERVFGDDFAIFPWDKLPTDPEGFDMGCGLGRWARFVATRVGRLHWIDPSSSLAVGRHALAAQLNVQFHQASGSASGLPPRLRQPVTELIALAVECPLAPYSKRCAPTPAIASAPPGAALQPRPDPRDV